MKKLKDRIKHLRKTHDFTITTIHKAMVICSTSYMRYETGVHTPNFYLLLRLVKLYGVRPEWLITGEGEMFNPEHNNGGNRMENDNVEKVYIDNGDPIDFSLFKEFRSQIITEMLKLKILNPKIVRKEFIQIASEKFNISRTRAAHYWLMIKDQVNVKKHTLLLINDLYIKADAANNIDACVELLKLRAECLGLTVPKNGYDSIQNRN